MKKDDGWKELKIDDLPKDILVGNYEFHEGFLELNSYGEKCEEPAWYIISMIEQARRTRKPCHRFYYRPIQKPQVSHEERLNLWWFNETLNDGQWVKVIGYTSAGYVIFQDIDSMEYVSADWFNNRKSATIPPEEHV